MRIALVPALVLILLPLIVVAAATGRWRRRWVQIGLLVVTLAVVAVAFPRNGVDLVLLKRLDMVIGGFVCLILGAMILRRPWTLNDRRLDLTLGAVALTSVVVYLNFFNFHGERTWVHIHDVAHYYLGAKYYGELGYDGLYTAMLRAEAEVFDNHFKTIEARDLTTYKQVHIRQLLEKSDPVKAAFSDERWRDFKLDAALLRSALGPLYGKVLLDHGFNPTPAWSALGTPLANLVPAGSRRGLLLLTLLDPLLLLAAFGAVFWAFGRRAALLAVIHFTIVFGATFAWTGGAFLRTPWLVSSIVALCCLKKQRPGTAGALLAAAALFRVFPAALIFPFAARAIWNKLRPGPDRRLLVGAVLGGAVLLSTTLLLPKGVTHWRDFTTNMSTHVQVVSPNIIGLTPLMAHRPGAPATVDEAEFEALKQRRKKLYDLQLIVVFLPMTALVFFVARRFNGPEAALLGLPLLLFGLNLAAYYWVILILVTIVFWRDPPALLLVFGGELLAYLLLLFDDRDAMHFIYRSVLIFHLLAGLAVLRFYRRKTAPVPY